MRRPVSQSLLTIVGFVGAALFGGGCIPPTSQNLTVGSIEVFGNASVQVGASIVLHTLIKSSSGSTISSSNLTVTWSSNDPSVASVDASGIVTGNVRGSAVITAESGGVRGSKFIDVTAAPQVPVASVTISGPTEMFLNESIQLQAVTKDAAGNELQGRNVVWTSSVPSVASVGLSTGTVTGVSQGSVIITASSEGKSATQAVRVKLHIDRIDLTGPTTVRVGENIQLSATALHISGTVVLNPAFTWQSADQSKATVGATGQVTGVAPGTVTISVHAENTTASLVVTVTAASVPSVLQGQVFDFVSLNGISGATVRFFVNGGSQQVGGTTTGANGDFSSAPLLIPEGGIIMEASATGYVTGRVLVDRGQNSATVYTQPIPLVRDAADGFISGVVKDARTGAGIGGATVRVFDNFTVGPRVQITSNNDGSFSTSALPSGTYRLEGEATGYQTTQRVGVVVGNNSVTVGQDLVLSPSGTNDIRIVLTWGASPPDVDSHLTGPNADVGRFHVYYAGTGNLTGPPFAKLDLDDTNQFGPETITITQMIAGNYRYSVHDFSNRNSASSTALGSSGAKVQVYTSTALIQTFFVPHEAGNLWTVFEMTGTLTNPVITPRNTMGLTDNPGGITAPPAVVAPRGTDADVIARAARKGVKVRF
jgi:uncharacterized protein YjdB